MNAYKIFILLISVTLITGCKDYLIRDYELETNPDFLNSISLLDYIEQGKDTSLTLYAKAIKYAELEDVVSEGNQTRVVPTNNAIRTMLLSAGVTRIEDLSSNVVRGLFSYLTIPGLYKSTDLENDETVTSETVAGDELYITRNTSGSDRYRLYINKHPKLASVPIEVIRQDYVFMDGLAHIVDVLPVYQEMVTPRDSVPDGVDYSDAKQDTIWVTDDASVYRGNAKNNYDGSVNQLVSRTNQYRYTFFKFTTLPIDYADDLTSVKLNFFVSRITGSNFIPVVGVYETNSNWDAGTLTWDNMPAFGQEVSSSELTMDLNGINVTSYMLNAYKDEKTSISFGLQLLNGANVTSSVVQIRNSEASRGVYRAYISLMGSIPSDLQIGNTSPVSVENNEIVVLTKDNFSMLAASSEYNYSDNNIIFVLMNMPLQGTLTKYGLPMTKFNEFTQEELSKGAIKYVHEGSVGADTFELKAKDYIGGVFGEPIQVSVNISQ